MKAITVLITLFTLTAVRCHVLWDETNNLQPVHGLYVKPSNDGMTGDLYVAASEDNGVSQWLTDQPINFLPTAAATQPQPSIMPLAFPSSHSPILPHEETVITQKRAVITSPPFKYAYPYTAPPPPPPPQENSPAVQYPYPTPTPEGPTPRNQEGPRLPHYSPFHYFYPHMMSAMANMMEVFKRNSGSEASVPTPAPPMVPYWPQSYPYHYPYQYVMVDPSSWAQAQAGSSSSPPTTSATSDENA